MVAAAAAVLGGLYPTITNPDPGFVIEPSALELANAPSLGDVAATSVYHLGVSGEGMTIGVVDSGVDKTHDELSGRVIGGGDWQGSGDGTDDPYGHGTHAVCRAIELGIVPE